MANHSLEEEKERCREQFRAVLNGLGRGALARLSERVARQLAEWLQESGWRTVATFAAIRGEVDLAGLHVHAPGLRLAYPRVEGAALRFHHVEHPGTLQRGAFGIPEPDPARHPEIPLPELEVILCPGLAFAANGMRLGRGGGFYDRALAEAQPEAARIGIGVEVQSAESLPQEAHDVLMTHRASELGVREVK